MSILNACECDVVTVTRDVSIQEAAKVMKDNNIGNIIVVEEENDKIFPVGILTDRDIVIKIAAEGADLNSITAGDAMEENLLTLYSSQGIKEALLEMSKKGVRRAPVVDNNNELVGILAVDDLLVLLSDELSLLAKLMRKQGAGNPVSE